MSTGDLLNDETGVKAEDVAALKSAIEEQKKLLDGYRQSLEELPKNWKKEREDLEGKVNSMAPQLQAAMAFDKLIAEDPQEAMMRIAEYTRGKQRAAEANKGNVNSQQTDLSPITQKLEKLEKELAEEKNRTAIEDMQNAVIDALDDLKSESGFQGDPKEVLQYMRTKGLNKPNQVIDAAFSLYRKQVIESKLKSAGPEKEPVVLGAGGYNEGTEGVDEQGGPTLPENASEDQRWNKLMEFLK